MNPFCYNAAPSHIPKLDGHVTRGHSLNKKHYEKPAESSNNKGFLKMIKSRPSPDLKKLLSPSSVSSVFFTLLP